MSLFHKRRDKVAATIMITTFSYSSNPNVQYQIECGESRDKHRTTQIASNDNLVNDISQVFRISVSFERTKKKSWKKKILKFSVFVISDNDHQIRVAKWEEDISSLYKLSSIPFTMSAKATLFGKIHLKAVVSKLNKDGTTAAAASFSEQAPNAAGAGTIERSHSMYRAVPPSLSVQERPKLTFEQLIAQDCQFFIDNEPEFIVHSPQFTMNIISHCSMNITQINLEFLLSQLTEAFGSIHNSSVSTDVYLLVSAFHLISTFSKRRWAPASLIDTFTEFLMSVLQDLMAQMKERFFKQIMENPGAEEIPQEICQWLTSLGSGNLCQIVFTGILFLFAVSFGKDICFRLCNAFCVRERAFTSLFPFIYDEPEYESELFEMVIHAILQLC